MTNYHIFITKDEQIRKYSTENYIPALGSNKMGESELNFIGENYRK